MNDFRILSIDEFDALFVKDLRIKKAEAPKTDSGLIPEIIIEEDKAVETPVAVADQKESAPIATEITVETEEKSEEIISDSTDASPAEELSFEVVEEEEKPQAKKSGGFVAGKVISIVMLCITTIVFLLGCFVSVFLDNNSLDIGGVCFSTLSKDVIVGNDEIHEGALIISNKIKPEEYSQNLNRPVAVRADKNASSGCHIMYLYGTEVLYGDSTELTVYDPMTNEISENTYLATECSGIVQRYVPFAGGIITFCTNNAFLVCALFALLAAFWCLILVLFEKNTTKKER